MSSQHPCYGWSSQDKFIVFHKKPFGPKKRGKQFFLFREKIKFGEKKIFDDFARHCGRWLALVGHSDLVSPSNLKHH